jgi:hypothetical protein
MNLAGHFLGIRSRICQDRRDANLAGGAAGFGLVMLVLRFGVGWICLGLVLFTSPPVGPGVVFEGGV